VVWWFLDACRSLLGDARASARVALNVADRDGEPRYRMATPAAGASPSGTRRDNSSRGVKGGKTINLDMAGALLAGGERVARTQAGAREPRAAHVGQWGATARAARGPRQCGAKGRVQLRFLRAQRLRRAARATRSSTRNLLRRRCSTGKGKVVKSGTR
jgi:hypothetical protein